MTLEEDTTFEKSVTSLGERMRPQLEAARRRLGALNDQASRLIKEHTAACLLGAVALGYVVARVARRQTS
jgi:hypothetical protein